MGNATLVVPNLPDLGIAFANNAAWQAYWTSVGVTVAITPATILATGVVMQANTLAFNPLTTASADYVAIQTGQGVIQQVATQANFDQLKAAFNALITDYTQMKLAMKNAGIINNN